jgi:hypothetical protein
MAIGSAVKIGHIFLSTASAGATTEFASLVEALDRLAVEQHALVASAALARRLQRYPYVTVGPVVRSPVMAFCLMPDVDLVHIHDERSGQAGLLLTLTRSIPFVLTGQDSSPDTRNPLKRSIVHRAQSLIDPADATPDKLVQVYQQTVAAWSKLPQDANCG